MTTLLVTERIWLRCSHLSQILLRRTSDKLGTLYDIIDEIQGHWAQRNSIELVVDDNVYIVEIGFIN